MTTLSTRNLQNADRRHHLHPFTDHGALHEQGTHILLEGDGVWVTDQRGQRLLDGLAGLWCVNVGYGSERIAEAVAAQLRRLPYYHSFFNSTNEPAIRLAERLAELAPSPLSRAVFSNSGSEANETAQKIVRAVQHLRGRPEKVKIVSRDYAYHGVTLGTTSLTGLPACQDPFDLPLPGFLHAPAPYTWGARTDLDPEAYGRWCLEQTRGLIEREGPNTIAAIFAEPVQGAGGVIVPPPGYLRGLRDLAREYDVLFVADEVITAFGRLGDWFASSLWGLEPDLMTLAKGLTSGYLPMGATLVSEEVTDELVLGGYFAHGFTYSGHPTCAAAALANLDEIEERGLVERVRDDVGPYFQERLASLADHPLVGEVRGLGLIGAVELEVAGAEAVDPPLGARITELTREEGAIVRGIRDLVALAPPLVVSRDEIDFLIAALRRSLDRLQAA